MEREKMEKCRQKLENLQKTMTDLEAQALKEDLLNEANALAAETVAKSLQDAKIVHANTTAMDEHLLELESTMLSMKTSIAVSQMQQKASG